MNYFIETSAAALRLIVSADREIYAIVWTSIWISVVAVGVASLLGIPLGLLVAFREFPGKKLLLQGLNTLMALPTVVVGLVLYGFFTRHGPLGNWGSRIDELNDKTLRLPKADPYSAFAAAFESLESEVKKPTKVHEKPSKAPVGAGR